MKRAPFSLEYDPEADAAYLRLSPKPPKGKVAKTLPCVVKGLEAEINLDLDAEGRLLGIEIISASRVLPKTALKAP